MTRSKYPSSSSEDVGVYALMTSSSLTLQHSTCIMVLQSSGHCEEDQGIDIPEKSLQAQSRWP